MSSLHCGTERKAPPLGRAFFAPASIAIIGASSDRTSLSGRPLEVLRQHSYDGTIYVVNPNAPEIGGLPTYASVSDIGEPIDLAMVLLPAALVVAAVEQCAAAGVRNVVIFSSGFGEATGGHSELEDRLRQIAVETGTRIAGPNCEGFLNVVNGVAATFSPAIDYEKSLKSAPRRGSVALVSQSGGLGFAILQAGLARGVGFSYVVSTGNEADLEALDYVEYLVQDQETSIVAMFVEGFKSATRFLEIAELARKNGTSIVVAKVGNSESGRRAAVSHTGHMAGRDVAYDAAFRRHGALRVYDPVEMVDVLVAMTRFPMMSGDDVGVLTVSGGAGAWMADALEAAGFNVPELERESQDALRPLFPSYGAVHNPVDATASIVDSGNLAEALSIIIDAPNVDAVVFVTSLAASAILEREEDALRAVIERSAKPVLLYSYTAVSPEAAPVLERLGIPSFDSPRRAVDALAALRRIHRMSNPNAEDGPRHRSSTDDDLETTAFGVCEYELNALLQREGIAVPRGVLAKNADEAAAAAELLGGPVALKVQSSAALHKRSAGGLALGVSGDAAVRAAYATIVDAVRSRVVAESIHGVLVQEMVVPGFEMMIGRIVDEQFGALIAVGRGGSNVELIGDVAYELAPVDTATAARMVRRLACWPFLEREGAAVDELIALVAQISSLELALGGALTELDLNPVMVYPQGGGVAVVDAKAVVTSSSQ